MKRRILFGSIAVVAVGAAVAAAVILPQIGAPVRAATSVSVLPQPVRLDLQKGAPFVLDASDRIAANDSALEPVAAYLADTISQSTGIAPPDGAKGARIHLLLDVAMAAEQYELRADADGIRISGGSAAGVFWGAQSLRQLLSTTAPWTVPAVEIDDSPRFAYRGAMLDVARHFFGVADVKRYIDDIAQLKINYLHLHLTDDQGWRIEIDSWPNLTAHGGTSAVGGLASIGSGFYTKADYRSIVEYAASRFVTIVPEIDMPGHTNAALSSYPELNCDGRAPALYTGIEVGFSSLCIGSETTYDFVEDVLRELAEMTPGPYLHIGGDESHSTTDEDFTAFAARVSAIGAATGKTLIGWHELGRSAELPAGTIGQYWGFTEPEGDSAAEATSFLDQGGQLIMSPADVAYLDQKYNIMSPYGLEWAHGYTSVEQAASWDPVGIIPGVTEQQILGIEAPLWSETLTTIEEVEYMAFPRIAAIAETAWSPSVAAWDDLAPRLAAFGLRLDAEGVTYYRSDDVPWAAEN